MALIAPTSQYTGPIEGFQITLSPGNEANIEKILQRVYPDINAKKAMSAFKRGSELIQSAYSDTKKDIKKNREIFKIIANYKILLGEILVKVYLFGDISQDTLKRYGSVFDLIEKNKNDRAMKIVDRFKEQASKIGTKISSLKTKVIDSKDKTVVAFEAASQKPETVTEIKSIFDKALTYLNATENHCNILSTIPTDTKEKIEQSANEWFALGYAHFAAMESIQAANKHIDIVMCSLIN